jgi:hypothetical protein
VYVLRHVYICAYACVVVAAKPRPAASSSSPPLREKGLFLDDSLQLWNTGKMCLHRTKQSPQKFFPVSDSRQLPALSSASHTCNLFVSQTLFISWCFSSHPFSFVCLSSWLVFVFAGSGSPASVCPSLCLGRVLPQSVTFLFSSWLWQSSVAVRAISRESQSPEKSVWTEAWFGSMSAFASTVVLRLPCSEGTSGDRQGHTLTPSLSTSPLPAFSWVGMILSFCLTNWDLSLYADFGDSHQMARTGFYSNSLTSCHPTIKKAFNCFFSSHPVSDVDSLYSSCEDGGESGHGRPRGSEWAPWRPYIAFGDLLGEEHRPQSFPHPVVSF